MKYIVYQTINLVNNKIYIGVHKTLNPDVFDGYIGCGVNIMNSGTYSHPTTAFQYAVKKYGKDKFKRSVLAVFDTAEAAYHMEESIVTKEFINRPDVYNMITGGIQAPTNAIKVYQFTLDGKFLKEWESAQEACDFYGVSHTAILNAINLKGSCRKYYWSRTKEIIVSEYSLNEGQVCYQYDQETGKLMNIYNSIYECSKVLGVTSSSIQRAVKGGYPFNGYYFSTSLYEEFKGNPKTQLHNSYLYVYDLEGNYLTKLKGIKEIMNYFNVKSNCGIYEAIRCNRPYKTWQLSLTYEEKLEPAKNKANKAKAVEVYDLQGNLIEICDSIGQCVEKYGTSVHRCLKGQQQQSKGFIFRYRSL